MLEDSFQSLFTDEPDKDFVPAPGYDGGSWRIKTSTLLEDQADDRFSAFQKAWRDGAGNDQLFGDDPFTLHGSVGRSGADNHRPDVAKTETFLGQAGYYRPTADGPSGYHNTDLDKAIRDFQRDNGLAVDGVLEPGGPTIAALKNMVGQNGNFVQPDKTPLSPVKPSPVLYAQAGSDTRTDAGPEDPADQQQAQAAPAAARLLQWGIPAAIAGGQAARNLLDEWWNKPANPPPSEQTPPQPQQPGIQPPEKVPAGPAPASPPVKAAPNLENPFPEDILRTELNRPVENSRGTPMTQHGNDIAIRECLDVIKAEYPELGERIQHVGGGTEGGNGGKNVKEEVRNNIDTDKWLGGSRADITLQFGDGEKDRYRINTTSMRKDGTMTGREEASFNNLLRNIGSDLATTLPKLRPGMDEAEYAAMARRVCRDVVGARWSDHLEKAGKISRSPRPPRGLE
ncbi:MAG: peptidoglycan-binding domain-containing protein [Actinomycetota bacterium]